MEAADWHSLACLLIAFLQGPEPLPVPHSGLGPLAHQSSSRTNPQTQPQANLVEAILPLRLSLPRLYQVDKM